LSAKGKGTDEEERRVWNPWSLGREEAFWKIFFEMVRLRGAARRKASRRGKVEGRNELFDLTIKKRLKKIPRRVRNNAARNQRRRRGGRKRGRSEGRASPGTTLSLVVIVRSPSSPNSPSSDQGDGAKTSKKGNDLTKEPAISLGENLGHRIERKEVGKRETKKSGASSYRRFSGKLISTTKGVPGTLIQATLTPQGKEVPGGGIGS